MEDYILISRGFSMTCSDWLMRGPTRMQIDTDMNAKKARPFFNIVRKLLRAILLAKETMKRTLQCEENSEALNLIWTAIGQPQNM